jgi:hypothetical protein
MDDAILGYGTDPKSGEFYSIGKDVSDFTFEADSNLLTISIAIDSIEESYERRVYNFFDFTGQLGGLFEILSIAGGIFVTFFAEKILMLSIISSLYQVKDTDDTVISPVQKQNLNTTKVKVMPKNPRIEEGKEEQKTPGMYRNKDRTMYADSMADDDDIDLDENVKAL